MSAPVDDLTAAAQRIRDTQPSQPWHAALADFLDGSAAYWAQRPDPDTYQRLGIATLTRAINATPSTSERP